MRTPVVAILALTLTGCATKRHVKPPQESCTAVSVDAKTQEVTAICNRNGNRYQVKIVRLP